MSILSLPSEILMQIAHQLARRDLNALLRAHSSLYRAFNDYLYYCNVHHDGSSALLWAATYGSPKTLRRLLDAGANVRWKPDYWKCSRPCGRQAPYLREPATLREHPISLAAKNGHVEIIQLLLQEGAHINSKDYDGRSPLALAALNGHFALVKILISSNACQLLCNRDGERSISDAASQGHHEIADYLLRELGRLSIFSRYPKFTIQSEIQRMLSYAAKSGDQSRIKNLVARGADVNFQFQFASSTPLCSAVACAPSPVDVVKLFLDLGADPNIRATPSTRRRLCGRHPKKCTLPLHRAMNRDESYLLIKLLLESGANAKAAGWALFLAVQHKKPAEFRLLVEHGANLYARGVTKSLFKYALESPCEEIRNIILERGITPDTPDPNNYRGRRRQRVRH